MSGGGNSGFTASFSVFVENAHETLVDFAVSELSSAGGVEDVRLRRGEDAVVENLGVLIGSLRANFPRRMTPGFLGRFVDGRRPGGARLRWWMKGIGGGRVVFLASAGGGSRPGDSLRGGVNRGGWRSVGLGGAVPGAGGGVNRILT